MRFIYLFSLLLVFTGRLFAYNDFISDSTNNNEADQGKEIFFEFKGKQIVRSKNNPVFLEIKVVDKSGDPISNLPIVLKCIGEDSLKIKLDSSVTDSSGRIIARMDHQGTRGSYKIVCHTNKQGYIYSPGYFELNVWANNWIFLLIVGLTGGLSLFLFGMSIMSSGLQNSAGNQIRNILNKLTNNRFSAFGIGMLFTIIVQSSSATNVMLVSVVNSRLLKFRQSIGIILGASIGTIVTIQIMAFKISDYALIFVTLGIIIHFLSRKPKISEVGKSILGFGLLFYGMYIMSGTISPLKDYSPFINFLARMESPLLGILTGIIFTAVLQSSGAFIGLLIILSMQGLISLPAAISMIIGANVGTSVTAILASVKSTREAQQVAVAHTLIKLVGGLIIVFIIPEFTRLIASISGSQVASNLATPRDIANAQTIYITALCLLFLPFTISVARFVEKIYPSKTVPDEDFKLKYLDDSLLISPALALNAARFELLRMMREVETMTESILIPFLNRNLKALETIRQSEEKVNFYRDNISNYLVKISRTNVNDEIIEEAFILMNAVREFEQIGDIISNQLYHKAESWCTSNFDFSESGKSEIKNYLKITLGIIESAIKIYQSPNLKKAQELKHRYKDSREKFFELERLHYDRLKENIENTILSSKTHLEILTLFRVICSHATNTARIIIYRTGKNHKKLKK